MSFNTHPGDHNWFECCCSSEDEIDHENAIKRGKLRTNSNGERPTGSGPEAEPRGVRATVQVQRDPRDFNVKLDGSLEEHTIPGRQSDLRAKEHISTVAPERCAELRAACDTLCRFFEPLGFSRWSVRCGDTQYTLSGRRFGGPGTALDLRLQRVAEPVARPVLLGSNVVKTCSSECTGGRCCGESYP